MPQALSKVNRCSGKAYRILCKKWEGSTFGTVLKHWVQVCKPCLLWKAALTLPSADVYLTGPSP